MNASADDQRSTRKESFGRAARLAIAPAAATALVFIPIVLRSPSTTEAVPGAWFVILLLAAPLAAYFTSRLMGIALDIASSLVVGLPQVPLIVGLSTASIWLDVQRGYLLAGSGEEAMSYGIGTIVAFIAGAILLILVAVAARLGARRKPAKNVLR